MSTIDQILLLLKDGEWHEINEIAEKVALPKSKIKIAFEFLNEYDYIQLNENKKSAKLTLNSQIRGRNSTPRKGRNIKQIDF